MKKKKITKIRYNNVLCSYVPTVYQCQYQYHLGLSWNTKPQTFEGTEDVLRVDESRTIKLCANCHDVNRTSQSPHRYQFRPKIVAS